MSEFLQLTGALTWLGLLGFGLIAAVKSMLLHRRPFDATTLDDERSRAARDISDDAGGGRVYEFPPRACEFCGSWESSDGSSGVLPCPRCIRERGKS